MHRAPLQPPATHDPNAPGGQAHPNPAIPTSLAIDGAWLVVGLANSRIHIFSAKTGVLARTLVGHESGVWAVALVSAGGVRPPDVPFSDNCGDPLVAGPPSDALLPPLLRHAVGLDTSEHGDFHSGDEGAWNPFTEGRAPDPPPGGKPSYPGGASDGWGQPNALVVSGGCDKELRVWDVKSGCVFPSFRRNPP